MKFLTLPYRFYVWMARTRPIRFTRFGTFYVLFSIGVGAAAINTGNNLLYLILGILLGFIVISGFLSDSGLWGIRTEWRPMGSLYAGKKAEFECLISKGWFPGIAVTVEPRWQGLAEISAFVPWIPSRGTTSFRVPCTPLQRGHLTLERCRYATRFPFGLFQKSHTWRMEEEHWVVYPRIQLLSEEVMQRLGQDYSRASSARLGQGSVPFVLRDYRTGDALRQVHWKSSARRARLVVKQTEEEASDGDLFVLQAWPVDLDSQAMEGFISFLASLLFSSYERGRPVGLAAPERVFPPEYSRAQLHRVLEYLALVQPYISRNASVGSRSPHGSSRIIDVVDLWAARGVSHAR